MARIVRLRQFASTPGQDHFIHDPAWQQGKKIRSESAPTSKMLWRIVCVS